MGQAEQIFYGIAIISSLLFLFQLAMSLIGLDHDLDVDMDVHDFDGGVSIFSIRGIIAFFMFFGWGGVAALSQGFSPAKASMIGFLIGMLAMVAVGYVFAQILKLQESGTVHVESAISRTGEVYITIPSAENGQGRIQIELEGKTMEFDAVTKSGELSTGCKIKVIDVLRENVMLVEPV